MVTKRMSIALLVYVVLTFAWAIVWNLVLFKDSYHAMTGVFVRDPPLFPLGLGAMLIQAVALVYLFERYYRGRSLWEAVLLTFACGLFTTAYGALVVPAKFLVLSVPTYVLLEAVYGAIHHSLVGLALYRVYRS